MKTSLCSLAGSKVLELFFPQGCACCGKSLFHPAETWRGICFSCAERLFEVFSADGIKRCSVCGKPLVSELERCMACRRGPEHSFDRLFSVFPYQGDYRNVLAAYKFGARRNVGRFLAACLMKAASSPFWGACLPDGRTPLRQGGGPVWVPVPPRPGKIRKAGWDQVDHLAKLLEKNGETVCRCLKRLRSGTQKILGREARKNNLRGKILVRKEYAGGGKTTPPEVFLFDDVYTTGSTMDACAAALKASGTAAVCGICLFYD
ncbi:MAG: double zinc ribbon domain-containing protein [Treponema sp.]|jgi:ComF family protein|nr:double zinc ribbon domain-containing protein [Treponema sp.]